MKNNRNCRKCNELIPNRVRIDGVQKNLSSRKFCLKCSPFKKHNTKKDIDCVGRPKHYNEWSKADKKKNILSVLKRGLNRKLKLIEMAGGGCKNCKYKYNGSTRALVFHHRDPEVKSFNLCMNNLWSTKWEIIVCEFEKCDLLCANCHAEIEDKISFNKNTYRDLLHHVDNDSVY